MRVMAVQGFWGQKFERELRETLLRETPVEAEVHVVVKPGSFDVETRVALDGSSATCTVGVVELGDVPTKRILEIVRELAVMLPEQTSSTEGDVTSSPMSSSEKDNYSFRQATSANGYHQRSKF